jgi:hypothetical protein
MLDIRLFVASYEGVLFGWRGRLIELRVVGFWGSTNLIPLLRNLPAYPTSPTSPSSTSTSISPSNNLDSELESSSRRPKRPDQILILVGAIELAHQAMSTIKKAFPGLNVELEQGKSKGSGKADV